jgi:acetyl esterase/lipase
VKVKLCCAVLVASAVLATMSGSVTRAQGWEAPAGHEQIALWPGTPPDAARVAGPETVTVTKDELVAGKPYTYVEKVSRATMTVFSPPPGVANTGAAVIVFPGGGYWILAIDLEGTEVCDWLVTRGVTCVVLKYRVPGNDLQPQSGPYPKSPMAIEDAQRAIRLVRSRAAEWEIDPHKVGVLGFSAGGHLVAAASTLYDRKLYARVDAADDLSARPDFGVALYPGHLWLDTKALTLNPAVPVTAHTPSQFVLQAEDDPVDSIENSLVYYEALRRAHVAAELHIYPHGGHAFGLRETAQPITHWPRLVETWLVAIGMVPGGGANETSSVVRPTSQPPVSWIPE